MALVKLLRKDQPWHSGREEAFNGSKIALTEAPVLARPDFTKVFKIQADTSNVAIGAVLTQEHEDGEHPIIYVTKVLNQPEKNDSDTDRELLAILFAIRKFCCYIEGSHFLVESEHRALKYLQTLKEPSGRLACCLFELQQCDFKISH